MGQLIRLGEIETWYDEHGAGEPLVLLHPGGADARAWAPNLGPLAEHFHVFTPERRAHGRTPDVDGPLTYDILTRDTAEFIERVVGEPAHLVGCSAGAVLGLLVALARPDLVRRVALVSGVHHRNGWYPEAIDPAAEPHPILRQGYEELSPDGAAHYPIVWAKLARLNFEEPRLRTKELAAISARTLVMVGDDDEMSLEHSIATYRAIPDAELAVVPGTSHGLLHEKAALCNTMLLDFLLNDPVPTFAPIRRRQAAAADS